MKIETKLEVGERAWLIIDNVVRHYEIIQIQITVMMSKTIFVDYDLRQCVDGATTSNINENRLFRTKQELLSSL